MPKNLTTIARIQAKPEKLDLIKSEVLKLIEPTRKENGCIQYDLHQDNEKPEIFVFYENWESLELRQEHMENQHLKEFIENTEDALAGLEISQMKGLLIVQTTNNLGRITAPIMHGNLIALTAGPGDVANEVAHFLACSQRIAVG